MSNARAHRLAQDIKEGFESLGVPLYPVGILLQAIHLTAFLVVFYLIFTVKTKSSLWISLMMIVFILVTQIYFNGCLISRIERYLTNFEKTIFERILEFFGRTDFVTDAKKMVTSGVLVILLFLIRGQEDLAIPP